MPCLYWEINLHLLQGIFLCSSKLRKLVPSKESSLDLTVFKVSIISCDSLKSICQSSSDRCENEQFVNYWSLLKKILHMIHHVVNGEGSDAKKITRKIKLINTIKKINKIINNALKMSIICFLHAKFLSLFFATIII